MSKDGDLYKNQSETKTGVGMDALDESTLEYKYDYEVGEGASYTGQMIKS